MDWDNKVQKLLGHCTSRAAFGTLVTHIPKIGSTQDLRGVWDDTYLVVNPEDGVAVMSSDPQVGFRESDFKTKPQKGDVLQRRGKRYFVRAIEPDGQGGVTLILEKEKCGP